MKPMKLDAIDIKMLSILQDEGRITNLKLAERVGISPPSCLRRMRLLEEKNIISGYHAELNSAVLGFNVRAIVRVLLNSHKEDDIKAFVNEVSGWPEVRKFYMVTGTADCIFWILSQDLEAFRLFLSDKVLKSPNVRQVHSSMIMKELGDLGEVPIEVLARQIQHKE